jgi:hypothetical protein
VATGRKYLPHNTWPRAGANTAKVPINPALRSFGIIVMILGALLLGMTLPVLGETPHGGNGQVLEPLRGKERGGRVKIVVDTPSYAFEQEVDPATKEWKAPKWRRDDRTLLGMLGVLPPHTLHRLLAGAVLLAGLSLVLQPRRWLKKEHRLGNGLAS